MNQDVIGIVADILKERDSIGLCNLSLVSRIFRYPSQRALYSRLTLINRSGDAHLIRLNALTSVLNDNPRLCQSVRSVALIWSPPGYLSLSPSWLETETGISALSPLLETLATCPIQELALKVMGIRQTLKWVLLDLRIRTGLRGIFKQTTFRKLSLCRVDIPRQFFSSDMLPFVQEVHWDSVSLWAGHGRDNETTLGVTSPENQPLETLTRLTLVPGEDSTPSEMTSTMISTGLVPRALQSLHLRFDDPAPYLPKVPGLDTVEELHIEALLPMWRDSGDERSFINLKAFTRLRWLIMHQSFFTDVDYLHSWVCKTLTSIPSQHPNIRSIVIGLAFPMIYNSECDPFGSIASELWRLVQSSDGVLKPSAVKVHIHFEEEDVNRFEVAKQSFMCSHGGDIELDQFDLVIWPRNKDWGTIVAEETCRRRY
ncbi:hypothetical protein BDN72DRAFT_962934 [Pluteus cervinus]|uniref:Uncharacterized protein n=1 Tax=Pluteus cervinus TaxID=181527 RepID=A0ACD3AGY6_9AGAR|nr:hypothetical protein BDN72DRAFT_962934 [Pluteus cervinus]